MADLDYLRRKAQAAREFDHVVDGIQFKLRTPTRLETSIAYAQSSSAGKRDAAAGLRFERALSLLAVVGWSGVLARHVLPTHEGDEPMEFEPGAAELLFDAQPQWESSVLQALMNRVAEKQAAEDTAAKN